MRTIMLTTVLLAATLLGACHTAPGVNKRFGTYYEYLPVGADRAMRAAEQTVIDNEWTLIEQSPRELRARDAYDNRITITIDQAAGASSQVGVKVHPGESRTLTY